jgi:hypothetical protein
MQKHADHFINVLRAFKRGEQVQVKSRYRPRWRDVDLEKLIDENAVQYRIKPISL